MAKKELIRKQCIHADVKKDGKIESTSGKSGALFQSPVPKPSVLSSCLLPT